MESIVIKQITTEEIQEIFRSVLAEFYRESISNAASLSEIGGVELAIEITGLAKSTIYSLVSKRAIPHSKRGKRLYFSRKALLDWIDEGRRKTETEICSDAERIWEKNLGRKLWQKK